MNTFSKGDRVGSNDYLQYPSREGTVMEVNFETIMVLWDDAKEASELAEDSSDHWCYEEAENLYKI